jgi:hypothetical protein
MKIKFKLISIILLFIVNQGATKMLITIEPTLIAADHQILKLASLSIDNTFAAIVDGQFVEVVLSKKEKVEIKPIVPGFPNDIGDIFYSDPPNNVLWITSGRGISSLDIATKKTSEAILSYYGNDNLSPGSYLIPYNKKVIYVNIAHIDAYFGGKRPGDNFVLFDYLSNKVDFTSKGFDGGMVAISKDRFLFSESLKDSTGNKSRKWKITDKNMEVNEENKLTKKLNEVKIKIEYFQSKSYNLEKRMMFGWKEINDTIQDFVVRWKEGFQDVTVEPIILQVPEGYDCGTHYYFSLSGEWIKTTGSKKKSVSEDQIIFFHTSDAYPQGLSLGIVGGKTGDASRDNGAFVNHKEWGPLYVDRDPDKLNLLRVYRLNDALNALRNVAKK